MIVISEAQSAALVTEELAFEAARHAFIDSIGPDAVSFPVVIAHASDPRNRFTIKSAASGELAGLKVGSYFPTNDACNLPRHASMILLFDQTTGRIGAAIEGSEVNCYRTAAADAVATDALARPDAEVLALFGNGRQAGYEVDAVARIRPLRRILVVGRDPQRTDEFCAALKARGLPAERADAQAAARSADIIVTATTATEPLFRAEWVKPGAHISAMGADAQGKQELPAQLLTQARLFADWPMQSQRIGEFQHARQDAEITAIGAVLAGKAPGRVSADEITIFDSSGLALQDLHVAQAILEAAKVRKGGTE